MSIRKRTWETTDGPKTAWIVDYKDQSGTRRLKTFARQKDARAWWEGHAAHEIKQGTHTPESASITVAEAGANWIKRAELEGREASTVRQYHQHVELHINPRIGNVKLAKLTTPVIEHFRDELIESLSRPMAKKVLTSLKGLLKEAQRRGKVAQNVALPVSVRMAKRDKRRLEVGVDVPSPEEIRQIIAKAKGRWRPLIVTAIFTGLRSSELRGLAWEHVDLEAKVIRVRQRADKWHELGSLKSHAGDRDVPMPPMVVNVLKEWRLQCPKSDLGLVFPTGAGNVEAHSNIYRRGLGATLEACKLVGKDGRQKYGLHALRHFYASWLIGQGFKPKRVQELLGHSSIQMTFDVYGHLFPSEEDDHERLAAGELALVG
jgi:integrase